jgi:hypothetical protein
MPVETLDQRFSKWPNKSPDGHVLCEALQAVEVLPMALGEDWFVAMRLDCATDRSHWMAVRSGTAEPVTHQITLSVEEVGQLIERLKKVEIAIAEFQAKSQTKS